jgi:putative addiction module component (TIGR02574 family)
MDIAATLTQQQKTELSHRLADHLENPLAVIPWEIVKIQALARRK